MLPSVDDCDDCVPAYAKQSFGLAGALSTLPFVLSFLAVTTIVLTKIYPLLSHPFPRERAVQHGISSRNRTGEASTTTENTRSIAKNLSAITFSSTVALSVVLIELLLCEISNSFNPAARSVALQFTVTSLLVSLVVTIPLIEIHSILSNLGWKFVDTTKGRKRLAWLLEFVAYVVFLACFWTIGQLLPYTTATKTVLEGLGRHGMVQAGLERLGVAGISSMALLSGFASVSSIWHNLVTRPKHVSEADIERKRAGLDATTEMLSEKKDRLRRIDTKLSTAPTPGFWSRAVGSIRGNADTQERQTLEMEVSGLDTMANSLESTLSILKSRRNSQLHSQTALGRLTVTFSYSFSCYCVYRIGTTTLNIFRRLFSRDVPVGDSDPVTNIIALFARHVYPSLDQASWARQISFLLSGIMLLASFSAVMQTFHLFARFAPSMLHATRSNFALIIAQISGMYVISSALMLRGMMPKEFGSVISDALGVGVLEPVWASKWFDGFFIVAVLLTAQGIWLGRKIGGSGAWDDDSWDGDVEMGKRL
jgi:Abscisic acid G-protein coupled receptor/The Golgi pH Regulator (GPHR) Family N-terminal